MKRVVLRLAAGIVLAMQTAASARAGEAEMPKGVHVAAKLDGAKPRFMPDPAPVVDGEWLYVFAGHDEPDAEKRYHMREWCVVRTKDMEHWEDLGCVMDLSAFKWARQDDFAWASQAIRRNGKWYWYVAVRTANKSRHAIGVAVADDPKGPWKDGAGKPLTVGPCYIDPTVFVDNDGTAWLFFGNCWGYPGLWYAQLKDNMVELVEREKPVPGLMDEQCFGKPLVKYDDRRRVRNRGKPITNFEEAPWLYRLGDTYYLEYAAGVGPETWAYSTAKSIHGPWTYRGEVMGPVGRTFTVHGGSVFFRNQWYFFYHDATYDTPEAKGGNFRRSAKFVPYARNPDGTIPRLVP